MLRSALLLLACLSSCLAAAEPAALPAPAGEAVLAAGTSQAVGSAGEATVHLVRRGALGLVRIEDGPAGAVRAGRRAIVRREMIGDHLLVRLVPGADPIAIAKDLGGAVRGRAGRQGPWMISVPVGQHADLPAAAIRLSADQRVLRVEPDWVVQQIGTPDDPSFPQMWALHNTGQTGGTSDADIDAPEAWDIGTGSRSVLVGVIDTGVDRNHPDLVANMWVNPGEDGPDGNANDKRSNGIDDDGNGFIDDWRGWDFINGDNDPADDHGHGTHTAGTVGAVGGNGTGVSGVCWQVSLIGIKFLGPFGGTTSGAIASVDYARTIGCSLTSNSWGGGGFSQELSDAIAAAGAAGQLFVAAAGNSAGDNDLIPTYPASYPLANIISVAATDHNDALAYFSCFGATSVDLAAPGVDILSTLPGATYGAFSGTSMATPHVAGACALLRSVNSALSAAEIKQALLDHADTKPALASTCVSGGRLNLHRALLSVAGPQLTADALIISEIGNGDGILNPGESASIALTLRSSGAEHVIGAAGTLSTSDGSAIILDGTTNWGDMPRGAVSSGNGLFTMRLPATTTAPRDVPMTITVTAAAGGPWTFPVTLAFRTSVQLAGQVLRSGTLAPVAGATVTCVGPGGGTTTSDGTGHWSRLVTDGSYTISASAPGLISAGSVTATAPPGRSDIQLLLGEPQLTIAPVALTFVVDQGEAAVLPIQLNNNGDLALHASISAQSWTATGLWHQASWRSPSGDTAWYYGRDDTRTYNTGTANSGILSTPPLRIPFGAQTISFREWRVTENFAHFDASRLEASTDGGASWVILHQSTTNTAEAWRTVTVAASMLAGTTAQLRFSFDTVDGIANDYEGWYVDDLRLDGATLGDWLSATPQMLSVAAGSTAAVSVRADAALLPPGTYTASLRIASDAPSMPELAVPVTLTVQPAPALAAGGLTLDDSASPPAAGDGDGWPEPGETVAMTVTLRNDGFAQAQGVAATLVSDHGQLQILAGSTTYPDIASNGTQTNQHALAARIDESCPDGTVLLMHLSVSDSLGHAWTIPLSVTVDRRGHLTGTATIADGTPVAGAVISVAGHEGTSAADGTYLVTGVPLGEHMAIATAAGHSPTRSSVNLNPHAVWDPLFGNRQLAVSPTALALTATRHGTADSPLHLGSAGSLGVNWGVRARTASYVWDHSQQIDGPAYAWNDIQSSGTLVAISGDDLNVGPLALGFDFPFYGTHFGSFRICSNGWISFTSDSPSLANWPLPSVSAPENMIAALWADLVLTSNSSVHVAQPDSQRCVIQFTNAAYYGNLGRIATFQIILHRDGTIILQYQRVDDPTYGTVGIQDSTRTAGLTVVHNTALVASDMAIRIRHAGVPWVQLPVSSGYLPSGASLDAVIRCAPAGLPSGTYRADILVESDDSDSAMQLVPLTLTVVNPHAPVADTQAHSTMRNTSLAIQLTGSDLDGDPLNFAIMTPPSHGTLSGSPPHLSYTPATGYLGSDNFSFAASDGELVSSPTQVAIEVVAPVVVPSPSSSAPSNDGGGGCGAGAAGLLVVASLGLRRRRRQG